MKVRVWHCMNLEALAAGMKLIHLSRLCFESLTRTEQQHIVQLFYDQAIHRADGIDQVLLPSKSSLHAVTQNEAAIGVHVC